MKRMIMLGMAAAAAWMLYGCEPGPDCATGSGQAEVQTPVPEKPYVPDRFDAWNAFESIVRSKLLRDPGAAKFDRRGYDHVRRIKGTDDFLVNHAWVDTTNLYGAGIRTWWTARVRYNGCERKDGNTYYNWQIIEYTVD